jgi:YD repeat-containing protein
VRDQFGRYVRFTRNGRGHVTRATTHDGLVQQHLYEDPAKPDLATLSIDERGNETRWAYDEWGNVTEYEPARGTKTTIAYYYGPRPFFGTPMSITSVGDGATETTSVTVLEGNAPGDPNTKVYTIVEDTNGLTSTTVLSASGRPIEQRDTYGNGFAAERVGGSYDWRYFRLDGGARIRAIGALEFGPQGAGLLAIANAVGERTVVDREEDLTVASADSPSAFTRYTLNDFGVPYQDTVEPHEPMAQDQVATTTTPTTSCGLQDQYLAVGSTDVGNGGSCCATCLCEPEGLNPTTLEVAVDGASHCNRASVGGAAGQNCPDPGEPYAGSRTCTSRIDGCIRHEDFRLVCPCEDIDCGYHLDLWPTDCEEPTPCL